MRPMRFTLVGTTPKIFPLDIYLPLFNVAVKTTAATVEVTYDDVYDTNITPTWQAAPAAVANVTNILIPCRAVRVTGAGGELVVVIQAGTQ